MKNIKDSILKFIREIFKDIVKHWILLLFSTFTIAGVIIFWRNLWKIDLVIKALLFVLLLPLCFVFGFMRGLPKKKKAHRYLEEHNGLKWEVYEEYKGCPYPEVEKIPHCSDCGTEFIFETAEGYPYNRVSQYQIRCPNPKCKKTYGTSQEQIKKFHEEVTKIVEARLKGYLKK